MPLKIYKRGLYFWVKGQVEYNGRPISGTLSAKGHLLFCGGAQVSRDFR
jgi:hypothetical protein